MIVIITLIVELGMLIVAKMAGVSDVGDIIATLLIIIFTMAFLTSVQNSELLGKYSKALMIGYWIRVFLLYFDLYGNNIYVLPNSGADTAMFYGGALRYMEYGGSTRTVFPLVMGTIFRFIGKNRLYGQFLVMLCSIASLVFLAHAMDDLSILEETKMKSYTVICLLPNFAILSSIFLRESIVTMFITLSVCMMVSWMTEGGNLKVVLAIASSMAAAYFHSGSIGITIGCLLTVLIYDPWKHRIRVSGAQLFLAITLAIGVSFVFLRSGNSFLSKFGNINSLDDIANTSRIAGSTLVMPV